MLRKFFLVGPATTTTIIIIFVPPSLQFTHAILLEIGEGDERAIAEQSVYHNGS